MVALTPGDEFAVYGPIFGWLNTVSASLSIVGALVVIVAFIWFPQLRRFFSRLVLYLAISDLWLCTSMIMGQSRAPHYTKCMIQSAMGTYFGLASILWTAAIADSMRLVLIARDLSVESTREARLHMFAWGLPLVAVIAVFSSGVAGPAGMVCWIKNTAVGSLIRFLTFYFPLWAVVGYSTWVYYQVTAIMDALLTQTSIDGSAEYDGDAFERQQDIDRQRRSMRYLVLIPWILAICWTPSTLRRVLDIFIPNLGRTPLDYIIVVAAPLQGTLNAIVYGATPAVRDAITGRLDHSARKLKSVQRRLKSLRPTRRRFERLDEGDEGRLGSKHKAPAASRTGSKASRSMSKESVRQGSHHSSQHSSQHGSQHDNQHGSQLGSQHGNYHGGHHGGHNFRSPSGSPQHDNRRQASNEGGLGFGRSPGHGHSSRQPSKDRSQRSTSHARASNNGTARGNHAGDSYDNPFTDGEDDNPQCGHSIARPRPDMIGRTYGSEYPACESSSNEASGRSSKASKDITTAGGAAASAEHGDGV